MKILVPIDHSKFSQLALRAVASLVRPQGNQVRVLHVIEHPSAYVSADMFPHIVEQTAQVERDREAETRVLVDRAAGRLRGAGLKAIGVVEKGEAKSVIVDYARKWGADLIVVGSHGLKGFKRALMGSVSTAVIRDAECSVQVVRMPLHKSQTRSKTKTRSKGRK
jgi:nucleotide-binding universal stress UspA family protein